jgi:tetratricopeptide (TPR) repeat protein
MDHNSTDAMIRRGIQHHVAGQLSDAEKLYKSVLSQNPRQPDALHLLGVIAQQVGKADAAIELIQKAIQINPTNAEYHVNLGNAFRAKGSYTQAAAAYRSAIGIKPNFPEAYCNLGNVLHNAGMIAEAIAACREAIRLNPKLAQAYFNLGNALADGGSRREGLDALREAIRLKPDYVKAYNSLGNLLRKAGLLDEAIETLGQAQRVRSNDPETLTNLGNAQHEAGRYAEAIANFQRALEFKPNTAELHNNLGNSLCESGSIEAAVKHFEKSLLIDPELAEAHYGLAMALLLKGDYQRGFRENEWRWRCKRLSAGARTFAKPLWDKTALEGRRILLHADGGFGDTIQLIRYVPLVAARGGRVIVQCQAPLVRLLGGFPGAERVIAISDALPEFDVHCPIGSLPWMLDTTIGNIPGPVPYIRSDPEATDRWAARIGRANELKVGIAWAGNPQHSKNRFRSMRFSQFRDLARVQNIRYFSLQKGGASKEASGAPEGMDISDYTGELNDFADTAAFVANLDLVIAVDTSVAHLAGAMGKPTWALIPFAPDWRWLIGREDSPWYPTMRLFRQKSIGDWESAIERVAAALSELAAGRIRQ